MDGGFAFWFLRITPWILLLLLIFTWVPWRDVFEKLYGNNPYKAKVYVEAGEQITICKGKYYGDGKRGIFYTYKFKGIWQNVIVPDGYPFRYILGCRQIRVILGQPSAAPLGGMQSNRLNISASQLDQIFKAHIGTELARTIFGKAINVMTILIIIGVIAFAAYFLYKQTQPGGMLAQPVEQQQQQQQIVPSINNNRNNNILEGTIE